MITAPAYIDREDSTVVYYRDMDAAAEYMRKAWLADDATWEGNTVTLIYYPTVPKSYRLANGDRDPAGTTRTETRTINTSKRYPGRLYSVWQK